MTEEDSIKQHIEMMIHKRNRCEDWVASVASSKPPRKCKDKKAKYSLLDYLDTFSDSNESSKRKTRKNANSQKSPSTLKCEWNSCDFTDSHGKTSFLDHVCYHIENVAIVKKENLECYQCLWENCNFQTANASEIKRHVNYHAYHTSLKAIASELHDLWGFPHCMLDGENRNWLPDLSYQFECNFKECDFIVDNFQTFLDHVNSHLYELVFDSKKSISNLCCWKGCTFKCNTKTAMKIHLKKHTGQKAVACPTCGALFATNTKYMDHCIRKTPAKIECNRCQYCLRYFSSERLLRDHMRYHINSYKCSLCEMTCPTPSTLANHVRYRHLSERPFKCSECSFTSVSAEDRNTHMLIHETEPRYQCEADNCNFSCRFVGTFKKHFRSAHLNETGPIYCCHLCDKKYNRGQCLGIHLRKKHKLEHPPGHNRFRYMESIDGFFRLQVERYESLELNDVEITVTPTDQQQKNYILRENPTDDGKFCKTFTVCVDESKKNSNSGALIAIDELDEEGNLIRTSTVQEEVIHKGSGGVVFVDVNAENNQNDLNYCDNTHQQKILYDQNPQNIVNEVSDTTQKASMPDYCCDMVFVDANHETVADKAAQTNKSLVVEKPDNSPKCVKKYVRKSLFATSRSSTVQFSDNDQHNTELVIALE